MSEYCYKETFSTPYTQYRNREGEPFKVVSVITEADESHDVESLPMFKIQFSDGEIIEEWAEEVLCSS